MKLHSLVYLSNLKIRFQKIAAFSAIFGLILSLVPLIPINSSAKVTGVCSNCHTMHNSQGGADMATTGGPYNNCLVNTCVGCHTGTNDGTNTIPYVYSTTKPTFGTNTLAGGNFYWVKTDDAKGHNIFPDNPDDTLTVGPGNPWFSACGTNSCHANLHATITETYCGTRQGCSKCHMMGNTAPQGYHHADDGIGTKYVDTAAKGWYRFLAGHFDANGLGVKGIEHEKWNYGATASSHNEYYGVEGLGGWWGFNHTAGGSTHGGLVPTTTAYCTGCHLVFRSDQHQGTESASNPWIRHPSDKVIPSTAGSEYAAMDTTYNPNVPVARPSGFNWAGGPSSTVAAGTDMVMCLSCHVAHGSPHDDMLRWDYATMNAGGDSNTTGCFVCHTKKDTGG